jgi:hypothetical protein
MRRRDFIALVGSVIVWPVTAPGQPSVGTWGLPEAGGLRTATVEDVRDALAEMMRLARVAPRLPVERTLMVAPAPA